MTQQRNFNSEITSFNFQLIALLLLTKKASVPCQVVCSALLDRKHIFLDKGHRIVHELKVLKQNAGRFLVVSDRHGRLWSCACVCRLFHSTDCIFSLQMAISTTVRGTTNAIE